jgi:hypothetical protein
VRRIEMQVRHTYVRAALTSANDGLQGRAGRGRRRFRYCTARQAPLKVPQRTREGYLVVNVRVLLEQVRRVGVEERDGRPEEGGVNDLHELGVDRA